MIKSLEEEGHPMGDLRPEEREELRKRLEEAIGATAAEVLMGTIERLIAREAERALSEPLRTIQEAIARIGEGSERTHNLLARLIEPQARMEERVERVESTLERLVQVMGGLTTLVERLAQAHARTEERVGRLEATVERLAGALEELKRVTEQLAHVQAGTEERIERLEITVSQLTQAVRELRTTVEQLAQAQARTEEHMGRLEAIVQKLAQAQAQAEERMGRLEATVQQLAEAQARMEGRVGRLEELTAQLAQGQAELREATKALAEEQVRMQKELRHLAKQVGELSEALGADLEDLAYIVLHDVLEREFGWDVGPLERTWQRWDDRLEEIDIFGQAADPARPGRIIWIVGEAKYNLTIREVERFAKVVERARKHLIGEIFPLCFCWRARPEVQQHARKLGLRLVFSYGRML